MLRITFAAITALALPPGSVAWAQAESGGIDSRFVRQGFGGTWLLADHNGDGVVSDIDAALKVWGSVGDMIGTDANGDGVVSAGDTAWLVTRMMSSAEGDVNGDGTVDEDDFHYAIHEVFEIGAFDPLMDADGDLDNDLDDVLYVMGKVDEPGFWRERSVGFIHVTMLVQEAGANGPGLFGLDYSDTRGHLVVLSDGRDRRDHQQAASESWPANHERNMSLGWPAPGDHFDWPANHPLSVSGGWLPPPEHTTYATSQNPAAYHTPQWSHKWRDAPGHALVHSLTWDPDGPGPLEHALDSSRRFPPNHTLAQTQEDPEQPGYHYEVLTCEWYSGSAPCVPYNPAIDPGHPRPFLRWPPSHHTRNSESWISHSQTLSMSWPPNHRGAASATWPERVFPGPGRYPPNHILSRSAEDDQGMPLPTRGPSDWPFWPQDHDWFTTIREGLDVPLKVIPLLPRGPDAGGGN